jgi:hypothetical protein
MNVKSAVFGLRFVRSAVYVAWSGICEGNVHWHFDSGQACCSAKAE